MGGCCNPFHDFACDVSQHIAALVLLEFSAGEVVIEMLVDLLAAETDGCVVVVVYSHAEFDSEGGVEVFIVEAVGLCSRLFRAFLWDTDSVVKKVRISYVPCYSVLFCFVWLCSLLFRAPKCLFILIPYVELRVGGN